MRFLRIAWMMSGIALATVPIVAVTNQSSPALWSVIAGLALVPFLLGCALSITGRLKPVLFASASAAALVLGTGVALVGSWSVALIAIACFFAFEPSLWQARRPVLAGSLFTGAVVVCALSAALFFPHSFTPVGTEASQHWPALALAFLYAVSVLHRLSHLLKQQEDHSRLAISGLDERMMRDRAELVTTHHQDGAVCFVSCNSVEIAGVGPTELENGGFLERVHVQDRVALLKGFSQVWHDEAPTSVAYRLRRGGSELGCWLHMEAQIHARRAADGTVGSIVAISVDRTAQIARERARKREQEKYARSVERQSRFLTTMSHELRTPLNTIIGFCDILSEETISPRQNEYLNHIRGSGQHLLQVINDLLDMSRIEAGKYEIANSEFTVDEIVRAATGTLRPLADKGGVDLRVDVDTHTELIHGDRRSWQQIIVNLLSNAIKFTPSGGTVSLAVHQQKRRMEIVIADTGIGMDEDFVKKVGQPFLQVESGLDRTFEGTGLGLYVAKALTALNGGSFELTSTKGEGTVATVVLPIQRSAASPIPFREDVKVIDLPGDRDVASASGTLPQKVLSKGDSHARLSARAS
ncbi:MAG: PAS domain-containing sensor histidine kinase [Ahrensia sp.]|nr:PAS domain-containing sensor histidine kinase [Ahrensia sp.]